MCGPSRGFGTSVHEKAQTGNSSDSQKAVEKERRQNAYVNLTFTRYSNAKPGGNQQANAKDVGRRVDCKTKRGAKGGVAFRRSVKEDVFDRA